MFGFDLNELKSEMSRVFDAHLRALAGLAFMALALAAIEYEEVIAPEMSRLSDGWSHAAEGFSRKLTSFTL